VFRVLPAQPETELMAVQAIALQDRFDDIWRRLVLVRLRRAGRETADVWLDNNLIAAQVMCRIRVGEARNTPAEQTRLTSVARLHAESGLIRENNFACQLERMRRNDVDTVRLAHSFNKAEGHHRKARKPFLSQYFKVILLVIVPALKCILMLNY
jgi:hypothetical protein